MKSLLFFGLILFSLSSCITEENTLTDDTPIRVSKPIEEYLVSKKIDTDGIVNGQTKYCNLKTVDSLDVVCLEVIGKLEGLEYFENLKVLRFRNFNDLPFPLHTYVPVVDVLDVSKNKNLVSLDCSGYLFGGGGIKSPSCRALKFGDNSKLTRLVADCNSFKTIDLSRLINLETLILTESYELLTLDLCNNKNLKSVFVTRRNQTVEIPTVVNVPAKNSIKWLPLHQSTPLNIINCK